MASRVVVVGLGPGHPALLTQAVRVAIDRVPVRYIRTGRHPSAAAVPDAVSFDSPLIGYFQVRVPIVLPGLSSSSMTVTRSAQSPGG